MKAMEGGEEVVSIHSFLIPALDAGEWLNSCPGFLLLVPFEWEAGWAPQMECFGEEKTLLPVSGV